MNNNGIKTAIRIFIILLILSSFIYFILVKFDKESEYIKILVQGTVTGVITYLGLYFTFKNQEYQEKLRSYQEISPFFVIACKNVSQELSISGKWKGTKYIRFVSSALSGRRILCELINIKSWCVLNVKFINVETNIDVIQIMRGEAYEFTFLCKCNSSGIICIQFDDVIGNQYEQDIIYDLRGNKCSFKSEMPICKELK